MQTLYQHIQDIYSSVVKRKVVTISESKKALNKIAMAFSIPILMLMKKTRETH